MPSLPLRSLLLSTCLIAVAGTAAAQESRFVFVGAYHSFTRVPGGIVARADSGTVRIEQLAGGAFRVRYAFTSFDPAPSVAVLAESLAFVDPRIQDAPESLVVAGSALTVTVRKHPLRLAFAEAGGAALMTESVGAGHQGTRVTHIVARPEGAHYFGLGEQAFPLDRTGQNLLLWNTDAYGYRSQSTPLYSSIPLYIGLRDGRAYGVYYDDSYQSEFDFGAKLKENVGFTAEGGELCCLRGMWIVPNFSLQFKAGLRLAQQELVWIPRSVKGQKSAGVPNAARLQPDLDTGGCFAFRTCHLERAGAHHRAVPAEAKTVVTS